MERILRRTEKIEWVESVGKTVIEEGEEPKKNA